MYLQQLVHLTLDCSLGAGNKESAIYDRIFPTKRGTYLNRLIHAHFHFPHNKMVWLRIKRDVVSICPFRYISTTSHEPSEPRTVRD
jgi:hypothetical protein